MQQVLNIDKLAEAVFIATMANSYPSEQGVADDRLAQWAYNSAEAFIAERRNRNQTDDPT